MAEDCILRRRELQRNAEDFLAANPSQNSVTVSDGGMSVTLPQGDQLTAESLDVVPEAESSSTPDERSAIEITDSVDLVMLQNIWRNRVTDREGRYDLNRLIHGFLMFNPFANFSTLSPEYDELFFLRKMLYEENYRDD